MVVNSSSLMKLLTQSSRRMIQESCAECVLAWKTDAKERLEKLVQISGISIYYIDGMMSTSNYDGNLQQAVQIQCTNLHISKACWISMSPGENVEEPIGYATEVQVTVRICPLLSGRETKGSSIDPSFAAPKCYRVCRAAATRADNVRAHKQRWSRADSNHRHLQQVGSLRA